MTFGRLPQAVEHNQKVAELMRVAALERVINFEKYHVKTSTYAFFCKSAATNSTNEIKGLQTSS
ncbi:hypothetical protein [Simplicispira metamorpha]|uniref:hypothetical protein n=1 Tax=Simplicispira metamorpha TaxID=80881 RepID=UPI00145679C9|nr:hypothetical protein [Simplicispira metamorpha]